MSRTRKVCPYFIDSALAVALLTTLSGVSRGESKTSHGDSLAAGRLVQEAIDAEIAGDMSRRSELLAAAIKADPDFGPARWRLGEVQFQGGWKTIADVGQQVSGDARWATYDQRRRSLTGSVAEHLELAQWCDREKLADEARYHWANVLLAEPSNKLARERLGVQPYRGGLFTAEQVVEHRQQLKQAAKDFEEFKPALTKLCARAVSRAAGRTEALTEIAAIDDPAKLEVLEYAVNRACSKAPKELAIDLETAYVAALSNMPQHVATLRLLNYAVLSSAEEIRMRATQGLSKRPATDYVPLLMAALTAPYEVDTVVFAAPDGTVRMFETIHQEGAEADRTHVRALHLETEGALRRDKATTNPAAVLASNVSRASAVSSEMREDIAQANALAAERNKRIGAVLKGATGSDPGDSAETWWQAWQQYNELDYPDERPDYTTYETQTYTQYYDQEKPVAPTPRMTQVAPPACECFAAGTPVWTKSGPVAIESIGVGDLVLTQNPSTGELAFRPVMETTVSEPVRVVTLKLPQESITSTLGHRFWVVGQGWQMAKSLKPSVRLHGLTGGIDASTVANAELTVCHNLVVDENHTFFVGNSRLLVHDKTCPAPTHVSVPGSQRLRDALPVDERFAEAMATADGP